ncbi:MAG TPA: HlyD family efflux transporter periplasmic adaptor subunit [Cellvibrionaceae bacterium]
MTRPQLAAINMEKPQAAANPLSPLLHLGRRARAAKTLAELGFTLVNETLQLLPFRQAAFWHKGLQALSGVPLLEANAPMAQWLNQLCQHLIHQPQAEVSQLSAAQCEAPWASEWYHWLPEFLLILPLGPDAVLVLAREQAFSPQELLVAKELQDIYQHAVLALAQERKVFSLAPWLKRYRYWAIAAIAVCVFPVRMSVLAPAEVVPRNPFVVRAPLEGVVDNLSVVPNQNVAAGDELLSLDTTLLASQKDLAEQAFKTAQAEYRQAAQQAVTDDKGKLAMALKKGELEERSLEVRYSQEQLARVSIKAERAGVAVFSDVNDWQGKALAQGERIMLIADPADIELKIDLPATDSIPLKPGASISLYPNAGPLSTHSAELVTQAYQAEVTPQGVLAYRIKARFTGETPSLGQQGTAKIYGERVPLIYYLLRKPFTAARQTLGF